MPYNKVFEPTLYNEDWLRRSYVDERRNAAQVAKLVGCTRQAVHAALKRFGIPVKGASEAQALAENWPGSSAPRPRGEFLHTLHSPSWLAERIVSGPSLSEVGKDLGCSPSAVGKALEKADLSDRWRECRLRALHERREARSTGARQRPFVPRGEHAESRGAKWAVARRRMPAGPCVVCGQPGYDVSHKNGNPSNNSGENLERLCRLHHRRQHTLEYYSAFDLLESLGVPRIKVFEEARRKLLTELL